MNDETGGRARGTNVEALLAETPWLRRLARGLLGDETAAEDLSQDVLAAALGERVELSGSRLRAWLRTVARRIAGRSLARERSRPAVEERAAASEIERDASERLEVHRRLAEAIERLPPTYRTAMVLRYFEELPPRAIAERLGVPPTAARKRLSRGLALLREELDRRYGGRESWAVALGACLPERLAPAPTPKAPVGAAGATVIAMSLTKLALLGFLTAAALGLWWWGSAGRGEATLPVAPSAHTEAIALPVASQEPTESANDAAQRAIEPPTPEPIAALPVAAPRLRVVDASGAPIAGARAAAIDARGFVRALELDEAASAAMPEDAVGSRFAARAAGHGPAITAHWAGGDCDVRLKPMRTIEGVLLEDGGVPARPLELHYWLPDALWDLGPNARSIEYKLRDLGLCSTFERVRTDDQGSFRFQIPADSRSASLMLPSSHAVLAINGEPVLAADWHDRNRARVPIEDGVLSIETAVLPSISGRLVWAEDGSPAATGLTYLLVDRIDRNQTAIGLQPDLDGSFQIGLRVDDATLLLKPDQRRARSTTHYVNLHLDGRGYRNVFPTIDLDTVELPYDLGTIALERAPSLELRVVDESGKGIEGALVWTREAKVHTDRDGLVRVEYEPGAEVVVLAPGYSLGKLEDGPTEPVELALLPGFALEVLATGDGGADLDAGIRLKIAWDWTPFEEARSGGHPLPPAISAFMEMQGTSRDYGAIGGGNYSVPGMPGYQYIGLPPDGKLVIPGLVSGGVLRLCLIDRFGNDLVVRSVHLGDSPGIQRVELEAARTGYCRLLVTIDGSPVPAGSVLVKAAGSDFSTGFCIRDGAVELGPMIAGTYELQLKAEGHAGRSIEACELVPGAPPLVIELEP